MKTMQRGTAMRAMSALFCAYCLAFLLSGTALLDAFSSAVINVMALGMAGFAASGMLHLAGGLRPDNTMRLGAHVLGSLVFTFFWYLLVLAGFALTGSWIRNGLATRAFSENAMVWQIFQGVTLYAILVLWLDRHPLVQSPPAASTSEVSPEPVDTSVPLLVRDGDQIISVALDEIVQLSGADSYVEIVTLQRTFLSSRTLSSLIQTLPAEFLRVHRSHIVRRGAIVRAEPAGNGRLTLHMCNGKSVITSRDGARIIRGLSG
jgi:hypothetical protein